MKVFISYSNRNRDLVESLAKDLQPALSTISADPHNEVWFDEQLVGGQDWWNTILGQLQTCDIFVFALSPNSIKSDACQRELRYATDLRKRILPIWITSDVSAIDLPELLESRQWINYSKQDKAAFQDLITALRQLPPAQPPPDPLPTPPTMPLSPLTEISHQLASDKLDRVQQNEILLRLKDFLVQPDQAKDAYQLLLRLKQHPDLRRSVAEDIDDLLRDHPEYARLGVQGRTAPAPLPDIPMDTPVATTGAPSRNPSAARTVTVPLNASVATTGKTGSSKWFGLNGRTIGLVIGILGGIFYPLISPTCSYNYDYGYTVCNSGFDIEYFIGSIVVWVLIGWGIDLLWRRLKKSNTQSP